MSRTISFRLDENNPDEARALAMLHAWRAKGWEPREVFTRLLLTLEGIEPVGKQDALMRDFEDVLGQLRVHTAMTQTAVADLQDAVTDARTLGNILSMIPDMWQALNEIRQLAVAPRSPELPAPETPAEPDLNAAFLASVKKGARPGMKRK